MTVFNPRTVFLGALGSLSILITGCGASESADGSADSQASKSEQSEDNAMKTAAADVKEAAEETSSKVANVAEDAAETAETAMNDAAETVSQAADDASAKVEKAVADASDEMKATPASMQAGGDSASSADIPDGDPAKGKRVFVKCMACHVVQEGQNRVGPSLYGIVGRPAGTIEGFNYSDANANSGIVWTEDVLFEYLKDPQAYIPGTRMIFPGLPSEQDRADVIAYLKSVPK